jgi:hypothetical protein
MARIYTEQSEELHKLLEKATHTDGATLVIPDLRSTSPYTNELASRLVTKPVVEGKPDNASPWLMNPSVLFSPQPLSLPLVTRRQSSLAGIVSASPSRAARWSSENSAVGQRRQHRLHEPAG